MAPPVGSEISVKIRSAIKAKLEELGAYVDEELPDYIMVMIANKKTADEMNGNLKLFLGNNATVFTKWLHDILDRLQSLSRTSAVPPKPERKEREGDRSRERPDRTRRLPSPVRRRSDRDRSRSREREPRSKRRSSPSPPPPAPPPRRRSPTPLRERRSRSPVQFPVKSSSRRAPIGGPPRSEVNRVDHNTIRSQPRGRTTMYGTSSNLEPLGDGRRTTTKSRSPARSPTPASPVRKHRKKSKSGKKSKRSRREKENNASDGERREKENDGEVAASSKSEGRKRISPPSPIGGRRRKDRPPSPIDLRRTGRNIVIVKPYQRSSDVGADDGDASKELSKPNGVVAAVSPKVSPEAASDDAPKSSIFIRAMHDMGIATAKRGGVFGGRVGDKRKSDGEVVGKSDAAAPSVLSRIAASTRRVEFKDIDVGKEEESKVETAMETSQPSTSTSVAPQITFQVTIDGLDEKLRSRLERRVAAMKDDDLGPISPSRIGDVEVEEGEIEVRRTAKVAPSPSTKSSPPAITTQMVAPFNTSLVASVQPTPPGEDKKEDIAASSSADASFNTSIPPPDGHAAPLLPANPALQQLQESLASINAMQASMPQELLPFNPAMYQPYQPVNRVAITLDDDDFDDEAEDIDLQLHGGETGREDGSTFVSGVYDPDEDVVVSEVLPKGRGANKILQRCKFYPKCQLGSDKCPFIHPSQPCRAFPKCPYGQSCVYIHPPCRFDGHCSRGNKCPFAHNAQKQVAGDPTTAADQSASASSASNTDSVHTAYTQSLDTLITGGAIAGAKTAAPRPPAPAAYAPLAVPCKFGDRCANKRCPFTHHGNAKMMGVKNVGGKAPQSTLIGQPEGNKFRWTAKGAASRVQPNRFAKPPPQLLQTIETASSPVAVQSTTDVKP